MRRGFIFSIHSVAGLLSGIFILVMSVSGALLVFHEEIDELSYPAIAASDVSGLLPVDKGYGIVRKYLPYAQISHCLLADDNRTPLVFTVYDSFYENGTEALQLWFHPQTGEPLSKKGVNTGLTNRIAVLHSSFFLGKIGEWLLGVFAIVFIISIISGFYLYRKSVLAVLSFKKAIYNRRQIHQLIGVYALVFNLMIAVTGFWMQRYVFKKDFYTPSNYTPVLKTSPDLFFSIDSTFMNMKKQYPGFVPAVIYFAQNKKRKTAVYGHNISNSFIHSKRYADAIFLDSTGAIANTAFVTEIDADSRYDIINAQVHYGRYGGWPVKILYSIFGLTGGVLSITGFLLWRKRTNVKM
jgi:uncharacterized iron-regulated membrane protein